MPSGLVIQDCRIKASQGLDITKTQSYLGRPWGNHSRVVIMESFIDTLIDPKGWMDWNGAMAKKTTYYAEIGNTGPGSSTVNRVKSGMQPINWTVASQFTAGRFIGAGSWIRGIPYDAGFINKH